VLTAVIATAKPIGASAASSVQTDPDHEAQVHPRPKTERDPLAGGGAGVVERELRGESGDQDWPLVPGRIRLSRSEQDERGSDRMPGVRGEHGDPPQVMQLPVAGSELAEGQPGRDGERHPGGRQHEQHRHEYELGRNSRAGAHLELDLRGDRVDGQQEKHRPQ
jgi:hypothetical protein